MSLCYVAAVTLKLENLAVYCRASEQGEGSGGVVLPKKVGQSSPKILRGCYSLKPPIVPNFIEIGQTSLEIGVGGKKISTQTDRLTHTRHPDWLSRASQHARGATKN